MNVIEFFTLPWTVHLFITLILGFCVLAQTLALLLSYFSYGLNTNKFKNNFFDVIFAGFNVIDEVEDIHKSISEIERVLKEGGLFIFSMHNRYYWRHLLRKHPIKRSGRTIIPRTQSISNMKLLCKNHFSIEKIYGGIFTPYPYFVCKKVPAGMN